MNTNVRRGDRVYHVQTEGRDRTGHVVETLIYCGGEILVRMTANFADPEALQATGTDQFLKATQRQHWYFVRKVQRGMLDGPDPVEGTLAAPAGSETDADEALSELLREVEARIDATIVLRAPKAPAIKTRPAPPIEPTPARGKAARGLGRLALVLRW